MSDSKLIPTKPQNPQPRSLENAMSTDYSPKPYTPELIPSVLGSSQPEHLKPKITRINSIDLLRGIVTVIMMLDHTRDFVHRDFLQGFDLSITTAIRSRGRSRTQRYLHFCHF